MARIKRKLDVVNGNGLTFTQWIAAAGGETHLNNLTKDLILFLGWQPKWSAGEDPTQYKSLSHLTEEE